MLCFSAHPTKKKRARDRQTDGRTHGAPTNEWHNLQTTTATAQKTHYTTRRIFPLFSTTWSQQHPSPLLRFVIRPSHSQRSRSLFYLVSTQSGRLVRHPSVVPLVLRGYYVLQVPRPPFPTYTPIPLRTAPYAPPHLAPKHKAGGIHPRHSTPAMYVCVPTAANNADQPHSTPGLTHRSPMSWSGAWYGLTSPGTARRFCSCCCSCCALCSCVSSW